LSAYCSKEVKIQSSYAWSQYFFSRPPVLSLADLLELAVASEYEPGSTGVINRIRPL